MPLENRSSHWTIAVGNHGYLIGLLLLTVFHLFLSAHVPPAEDELYYWTWAKDLRSSFYDHPPMVAWLIAFSTKIFGDSLFGIRFFSSLASLFLLWTLQPLCGRTQILSLVIFTPLFMLGSVLMTPDTPLFVFWALYLYWVIRLNRRLSDWSDDPVTRVYHRTPIGLGDWIFAGVLLGLGGLSKYTMALAVVCTFFTFVTKYPFRAWITGFVLHLAVCALVLFPVIYFNATHDFTSFSFHWVNSIRGNGFKWQNVQELLGSQLILVGAMPLLSIPWLLIRRRELSDDYRLHPCFYFFVIPFIFFVFQAFRAKVEANWPLFCYLSFWPLGQRLIDRSSFKGLTRGFLFISFILPVFVSFGILAHLAKPLSVVKPERDRLTKLTELYRMNRAAAKDLVPMQQETKAPLFAPSYQQASYFKYFGVNTEQLTPLGRASQYTLQPKNPCDYQTVYYFGDAREILAPKFFHCFPKTTIVGEYPFVVRGHSYATHQLVKFEK